MTEAPKFSTGIPVASISAPQLRHRSDSLQRFLREIAQNSAFTHGVFHYYFRDKTDLICCCVSHYKAKCVTRYDQVTASAQSREELMEGFLAKLAETLRKEARMHRLWYDLRAQALFEDAFRKDVVEIDKSLENMIWRIASRYAELGGKRPAVSAGVLYALFDGLFQNALLKHLSKEDGAIPELLDEFGGYYQRFAERSPILLKTQKSE